MRDRRWRRVTSTTAKLWVFAEESPARERLWTSANGSYAPVVGWFPAGYVGADAGYYITTQLPTRDWVGAFNDLETAQDAALFLRNPQ